MPACLCRGPALRSPPKLCLLLPSGPLPTPLYEGLASALAKHGSDVYCKLRPIAMYFPRQVSQGWTTRYF